MQNNTDTQIAVLGSDDVCRAEDLARIMISAWQSGFCNILPPEIITRYTQFAPCADMFRQILSSDSGIMYLATHNDAPVGLLYQLTEGTDVRIEALLTIPEVWGSGVAAALMNQALADTATYSAIHVWPFSQNLRARRFYEKHGFRPTGNTRTGDAEEVEYVLLRTL